MTQTVDEKFELGVPNGDDRERRICQTCGFVDYRNPRIVAGSVVTRGDQILLCKRAIEPRKGFWTVPAGYMELGETIEEAAQREAREEACAHLSIERLLAVYSVPRISQVQLIYRASLAEPGFAAGPESLDVRLFAEDDIPFDELAFPSVHWALAHDREAEAGAPPVPFTNPDGETGSRMPSGERLGIDRM